MITPVNSNNKITFTRRLTPKEAIDCSQIIQQGLQKLGKEVDVIIHSSCMPAKAGENTGIGSLLSRGAKKIALGLKQIGIKGIQIEPDGLRKGLDGSPYVSDTFAKNVLMIPLEQLKSNKYGRILSEKTFAEIVNNRPNPVVNRVDYNYIIPKYNEALKESFETFSQKLKTIESLSPAEKKAILKIADEFSTFKAEKAARLEKNSLYSVLTEIHDNDYYKNWPIEDRDLFLPQNAEKAKIRIQELKEQHSDKIDNFFFSQMLIDSARKASNKLNARLGIKTIGDSQVAFSSIDVWANPECFMKDWFLGCPPDYFSKTGQAWDFPILDPAKMFNKDGSLGSAGKLLYDKFFTMFKDNPGGVRIDHTIGMIDPYVYPAGKLPNDPMAGRLYSSPEHPILGEFAKKSPEEYGSIMGIVADAAKKAGINPNNIICEDLGATTQPTVEVIKKYGLRGIRVTQFADSKPDSWHRGKNIPEHYIGMIGSHDNASLIEFAEGKISDIKNLPQEAKYLADDILPKNATKKEKENFIKRISKDKYEFAKAKFAELFASPSGKTQKSKIQIFFTDLFGMSETYNKPGTAGSSNWSLRIPDSFEDFYHSSLQQNKGLNMPEILKMAIKSKKPKFVNENKSLLAKLDEFAKILKEPETVATK